MSERHEEGLFPSEPRRREFRPTDFVWEQMELLFGKVASGTNAHKKRNKAVSDMKAMDATPDSIIYAYESWFQMFSGAICTDIGLATHYPLLVNAAVQPMSRRYGRGVNAQELIDQARRDNGDSAGEGASGDAARGLPHGNP